MHPQYNIHALHGFLGNPDDWSAFRRDLGQRFHSYHLFKDFSMLPFDRWAEKFNQMADAKNALPNNILMGYSLGGRLALHALLQNPRQWKAAILLSTHPGLKSLEEKAARITSDEAWAVRFENEPWDNLIKAWNSQDVFKHDSSVFQRNESDNDRQQLASALRTWSLGIQHDLADAIACLDMPILWVVGEKDAKYREIATKLKFSHPLSKLCVVANAEHRPFSGQPEIYKQNINQFIKNL